MYVNSAAVSSFDLDKTLCVNVCGSSLSSVGFAEGESFCPHISAVKSTFQTNLTSFPTFHHCVEHCCLCVQSRVPARVKAYSMSVGFIYLLIKILQGPARVTVSTVVRVRMRNMQRTVSP